MIHQLSPKGTKLLDHYTTMAQEGYNRVDGTFVQADYVYNSFELKKYLKFVKEVLASSKSVLDYGCGGSNWYSSSFIPSEQKSALDYFELDVVHMYEPARGIDQRQRVDTVVCFDVLEHLFIQDVPRVLEEIYSLATYSVLFNIAGYEAQALLPTGENAHTTVRPALWWKGVLDMVSLRYPDVETHILYSASPEQAGIINPWKASTWINSDTFVTKV